MRLSLRLALLTMTMPNSLSKLIQDEIERKKRKLKQEQQGQQQDSHPQASRPTPKESSSRKERVLKILEDERSISTIITLDDIASIDTKTSPALSKKCNLYIHELLNQWTANAHLYRGPNPGSKTNSEGSSELLLDTKRNLFPLLVRLRKAQLDTRLLITLSSLLYHLQEATPRGIESALQLYLKLSIGDVAWPIGVSNVGIHARSSQYRISRMGIADVANIMVDEPTRLWIISIKRLISFKEWQLKHADENGPAA